MGKIRNVRRYSYEFKEMLIKEYLAGGGTYKSLSEKHNVPLKTISNLVGRYRKTGLVEKPRLKLSEEASYKEKYEILKNFQAFLEQQRKKK